MGGPERVIVCGAGPTGLGAAWRLAEHCTVGISYLDWVLIEQDTSAGGMARSETVDGFVWDLGGHVLFPHFQYFDDLLDEVIDEWHHVVPVRGAWMWDRFIPYPVQRNLRHLPPDVLDVVLAGLRDRTATEPPENFEDFLIAQFGTGLHEAFFLPLNLKMWATHPSQMSTEWADQRSGSASANVPRIDLAEVLADIALERDAPGWSPNSTIRYPATGGTGRIWQEVANRLPPERMQFGAAIVSVSTRDRCVTLSDGRRLHYERLVSTIPLDRLLRMLSDQPHLTAMADRFRPAAVHAVGIGMTGVPVDALSDVCSLYVPDMTLPFWRITVLSNFSSSCVPNDSPHWSLLCEVNVGDALPPINGDVVERVIDGLVSLGFVARSSIVSTWHRSLDHGYPVPLRNRERDLHSIADDLEPLGVYCRGRFGGWRYEASNQDHAFMQGLELVDRLVDGTPEVTYPCPTEANAGYDVSRQRLR